MWYGTEGDAFIDYGIDEHWYAATSEAFRLKVDTMPIRIEDYRPEPWGWSRASRKAFLDVGVRAEALPDDEALTRETLRGGFVHTHDVGRVGSDGMLRLAGRNDDIINVGGYKVNPAEVEEAAMGDGQVADCVCVAVAHPVTGHALKLWVVTTDARPLDKRGLAMALRTRLEDHQVPQLYEQTDSIRRTFNGKLDRESYKAEQPGPKG